MKKPVLFLIIIGLLLCFSACNMDNTQDVTTDNATTASTVPNEESKFVGTWTCDEWIDFQGDVEKNGIIILKADGTGTMQPGERWATFRLTWELLDENTIMIFEENFLGSSTGSKYYYEVIDGVEHLLFDNGVVTKDFYK